jgi:hypothetical protein
LVLSGYVIRSDWERKNAEGDTMANNDTRSGDGGGNGGGMDSRARLVDLLLEKIAEDPYPSETMMDLVEQLLLPDDLPAYAAVLMEKIRGDAFPSVSMMKRVVGLTEPV